MKTASYSKSSTQTLAAVVKRFYQQFKIEHALFSRQIQAPAHAIDRLAYTSLMLNRLMVLYFLQKSSKLENDPCYLSHRLHQTQQALGVDHFYQRCLLPLCAQLYGAPPPFRPPVEPSGRLPTLSLPLFEVLEIEQVHAYLRIPDAAFIHLFTFFDLYTWQLTTDTPAAENELRPDILASIFEHSLDQRETGSYYTQEDITIYIAQSTILPCLFADLAQSYCIDKHAHLWHRLRAYPDRYLRHTLQSRDYLVAETELEYQQRQTHYQRIRARLQAGEIHTIDDLITYNLDLVQFADDAIRYTCDSDFLVAIYTRLESMLILDPTCGTGAFLCAALVTLASLYTACIQRMQTLLASSPQPANQEVQACSSRGRILAILARVEQHPTSAYFILSTIITRNLYGVDLMQEAVEICRLRLALLLLATDSYNTQAPLATIPHNIRAGNALVGDLFSSAPPRFSCQANSSCADDLSSNTGQDSEHEHIRGQPFHWYAEFPILMERGGFDVILGNPPYLEYSRVKQKYLAYGYEEKSCGNLYAAVIERSLALSRASHGYLGLIVPISVCGGERFSFLRQALSQAASALWLANFEIFPCRLFERAFQRVSIILVKRRPAREMVLHVTRIHRWFAQERPHLIQRLLYTRVEQRSPLPVFPKLASSHQEHIIHKLLSQADKAQVATFLQTRQTRHFVYYQEATNYWTKAVCRIPYYRKNDQLMKPSHGRFLFFAQERIARIVMAVMNSSLFYVWFSTYADGFHLSHHLVKTFPLPPDLLTSQQLYDLALSLENDIQLHARISTHNTKDNPVTQHPGHRIELEEYQMCYSKHILDQIDRVLANYYSFTHDELNFIINYDIKYRMSKRRKKESI